jgi:DNA-binding CsgD family transcriptional regulator
LPVLGAWLDQARAELAGRGSHDATEVWGELASRWETLSCPYFAAGARYRQADALLTSTGGRATRDRSAAAEMLRDALGTADALGARPLRRDVLDLAQRARLAVAAEPGEPEDDAPDEPLPFGLTTRELEVLRLVADGRSNGEIGAQLFVSRKTASVHVSNILRKLGAANRIEAAAIARRHKV